MTEPSHAVFISYASPDAQAAQRICEALRAAGIEVWFDQSELRGGDAWDAAIRKQIKSCALFIPIISRNAHARGEGYFRLEWKLAVDRSHLMASDLPFLIPVVIDDTPDADDRIPERFREIQWTGLPNGETPPAFVERVQRLLPPESPTTIRARASAQSGAVGVIRAPVQPAWSPKRGLIAIAIAVAVLTLGALGYLVIERPWVSKPSVSSPTVVASPAPAAFNPPAHSIAVLPFVNMSGDKEQDYFSDGLTEELLNSLAEISELQVAARTSAFSFKGKDIDIGTIAHKLNVASVLEGSVRRSGNTVRVTAQLINAVTGYHLWSHTYDRDLGDVLKLETEIAGAVASALKVSLLGDEGARIELGGTRNPAAFDAYLRGRKAQRTDHGVKRLQTALAAFTEAIGLDPNYALAFASRSIVLSGIAGNASGPEIREDFDKALSDARKAIALAPDLAEGHLALANYFVGGLLDFSQANEEYQRALALAPGNARVLGTYSGFAALMGRTEAGIAAGRRVIVLDPLGIGSHNDLGDSLYLGRQYRGAIAAYGDALALEPESGSALWGRGLAYYALGDFERGRASCESTSDDVSKQTCLAVIYDKLGRHADAESMLAKIKASAGDAAAYQYAEIYAQWGDRPKALEWLDTAMRLRDPGLSWLKTDPLMDPLRKEPRFQAIERELKFPD